MTTEYTGEVIDFTPAWLGILPYLIAIVRDGETAEARKVGEEELRKMAGLADAHATTLRNVMPLAKALREAIDGCDECEWRSMPPKTRAAVVDLLVAARALASRFGRLRTLGRLIASHR